MILRIKAPPVLTLYLVLLSILLFFFFFFSLSFYSLPFTMQWGSNSMFVQAVRENCSKPDRELPCPCRIAILSKVRQDTCNKLSGSAKGCELKRQEEGIGIDGWWEWEGGSIFIKQLRLLPWRWYLSKNLKGIKERVICRTGRGAILAEERATMKAGKACHVQEGAVWLDPRDLVGGNSEWVWGYKQGTN